MPKEGYVGVTMRAGLHQRIKAIAKRETRPVTHQLDLIVTEWLSYKEREASEYRAPEPPIAH